MTADAAGPARVPVALTAHGNASVSAALAPTLAGDYTLSVRLAGEAGADLGASPFALRVVPGAPDARASAVFGPGTQNMTAGEETPVRLAVRDAYANPTNLSVAEVRLTVNASDNSSSTASAPVARARLGEYELSYRLTRAGAYVLAVPPTPPLVLSGHAASLTPY